MALLLLLLGICVLPSLAVGAKSIPWGTVIDAFTGYDQTLTDHLIVRELRLPRTLLGLLVGGFVVLAGYLSVNTVAKAEAFPPEVRALGVGFGYSIANSLFGGTAPMIYHASAAGGGTVGFTGYVLVLVAVSTVVYVFFTPRRAGQSSGSPLTSPRSQSRASTNTSSE
ncbi:iron chelate uptake ABC transporter family permease subunit [uncultured Microbacterium sp.]|nr:iron chelate uptake ABC transporter family permease subunit [uncultured Microbacterium sp.]